MSSRSWGFVAAVTLVACGSQGPAPRESRHASAAGPGRAEAPAPLPAPAPAAPAPPAEPAIALASADPIVARARLEVARGVTYDPAWVAIGYPNGDPAPDRGVCTDVVVRAVRAAGIDLQEQIHEDILARRAVYTTVERPDRNIDHRRVGPMLTYLRAHATSLPRTFDKAAMSTWEPGDIVVWALKPCPSCTPDHVGIVSDRKGPRGVPLVLHNIGPTPSEEDVLDAWTVLGHFRLRLSRSGTGNRARESAQGDGETGRRER
ncbi:DUF1287 domain-containing protein [Sorangium sp. So ce363]|uniref:DUF1287 domain-containing protein n=1 Tax=Sorangium sp. So ce363 TaxID=3133304 RepID=UPI003F5E2BB7